MGKEGRREEKEGYMSSVYNSYQYPLSNSYSLTSLPLGHPKHGLSVVKALVALMTGNLPGGSTKPQHVYPQACSEYLWEWSSRWL